MLFGLKAKQFIRVSTERIDIGHTKNSNTHRASFEATLKRSVT